MEAGALHCAACAARYPVADRIPRFVSDAVLADRYPDIAAQTRVAARFYDFVAIQQFAEIIGVDPDASRAEYLGRLELRPGARVLDVGCGTGAELVQLATRTPDLPPDARLELHGLDLSIHMLEQARRKLTRAGLHAELYVGLVEQLPFADDAFDVVFHCGAFNEFRDKCGAIRELLRVARPDTRIVIADERFTTDNTQTPVGRKLRATYPSMQLDPPTPLGFLPADVREVRERPIARGFGYCVEFRKPG